MDTCLHAPQDGRGQWVQSYLWEARTASRVRISLVHQLTNLLKTYETLVEHQIDPFIEWSENH